MLATDDTTEGHSQWQEIMFFSLFSKDMKTFFVFPTGLHQDGTDLTTAQRKNGNGAVSLVLV